MVLDSAKRDEIATSKQNRYIQLFSFQALFISLAILLAIFSRRPIWFDRHLTFSFDFHDFVAAARDVLSKRNPYLIERFNKPPPVAFLTIPFTFLRDSTADFVFLALQEVAIIAGIVLACRTFAPMIARNPSTLRQLLLFVFCSTLFSYPVFLVLDRGNLDGFVMFFCFLGVYFWGKKKWEMLSGISLGVAVCLKLYPLLLLAPLLALKKTRIAASMVATLLTSILISPKMWLSFVRIALLHRLPAVDGFLENGSLVSTLHYLAWRWPEETVVPAIRAVALLIFVLGVVASVVTDFRRSDQISEIQKAVCTVFYIPFMVSVPDTTFQYEYISILPLVFVVDFLLPPDSSSSRVTLYLTALVFAVALTQFPAYALVGQIPKGDSYDALAGIPGIGVLILLLTCTGAKIRLLGQCALEGPLAASSESTQA